MELDEAIGHALDGNALLFTGAGFSVGAKPTGFDKFLTGRELARHLYAESGFNTTDDQLNIASQIFLKKHGKEALLNELKSMFTAGNVSDDHKAIANVPWQILYTTNYDDILEKSYSQNGKKLIPILPSMDAKGRILSSNHCVHINGFIPNANVDDLDKSIKLSNSSYLTESFENSDWGFAFRKSLHLAKAIFFIGYSMYDLDIQRIVHNIGDLRAKTIFIERVGVDRSEIEFGVQSDFGNVVPIGFDGFVKRINDIKPHHLPKDDKDTIFDFESLIIEQKPTEFRDDSVFDLFLRAELNIPLILDSIRGDLSGPYFVKRNLHDKAVNAVMAGARFIAVHSDMANGKSAFSTGLACDLVAKGYDVFTLKSGGTGYSEDLKIITGKSSKVCVVIENADRYSDVVKQFALTSKPSDILIATYRTVFFENKRDEIFSVFDSSSIFISDLDFLIREEVCDFSELMSVYKFWGSRDSFSDHRKINFIEQDCNAQLSSVLLEIVKSPNVKIKFDNLLQEIANDSDVSSVLVVASVLLILDYNIDNYMISELLPSSKIYRLNLSEKSSFTEILSRSNNGKFEFRSSIVAKYALNQHPNSRFLIDQLIEIAKRAHDRADSFADSDLFFHIYKSMVTFSVLQGMLPEKGRRDALIKILRGH